MRSEGSRGRHRRVVVEFVGVPGAGKTTVALETVTALRRAGVTATVPTEVGRADAARTLLGGLLRVLLPRRAADRALWQLHLVRTIGGRARVVLQHAGLVRHVLRSQWGRPVPWRLRQHALRWWFAHAGRRAALRCGDRPGEVLVVDDGYLHRAATLHASEEQAPDAAAVTTYVDRLPPADLVVRLRVDPATCARRVEARGAWDHRPLDHDGRVRLLRHAGEALEIAVARARLRGWSVLEVDADGVRPEVVADRVAQHLLASRSHVRDGAGAVA